MYYFEFESTIQVLSEESLLLVSGGNETEKTLEESKKPDGYSAKVKFSHTGKEKHSFFKPVFLMNSKE